LKNSNKILNLYFAINNSCNISCKYCYLPFDLKSTKNYSDTKIIHSLSYFIEKVENEGWRIGKFCLHGAEPSLIFSKTMGRIINLIHNHWSNNNIQNLTPSIQTNGIRLTKSYLEELLDIINDTKKIRLGFSIDPPKAVHDCMRDGSYNIVMKNFEAAQKLGFKTAILSVVSNETMNYLDDFCLWIKEQLKNKESCGNPYKVKVKFATGKYSLNENQLKRFSNFIIKKDLTSIIQILSPNYCIQNGNNCEWYEFDIDGNCYSCNKNYNSNGIFANWKYESFDTITIKRKKLFENEYTHPDCSKCCYEMVCNSGCPIDRNKTGKIKGKAHECTLIKQVYKHFEHEGISIIEYFYNNK